MKICKRSGGSRAIKKNLCGTSTRATLPEDINPSGYGVRVVAIVALLSSMYRNSQRMVQTAMAELFGISMSLGTVHKLREVVIDIREQILASLQEAADCEIGYQEKTPLANTNSQFAMTLLRR